MTFSLSDDEQNGVSIAVNTILKTALGIGDTEDWSAAANQWWSTPRSDYDGKKAGELLADNPEAVVMLALAELGPSKPEVGIYVLPTEEDQPPRAAFLIDIAPGVQAAVGGAAYLDGAWRYPNDQEVEDDLAEAITKHAEALGVEWDH